MFAALDWWQAETATIGSDEARRMPLEAFKAKLLEKYFPEEESNQQEREFLSLVQGT